MDKMDKSYGRGLLRGQIGPNGAFTGTLDGLERVDGTRPEHWHEIPGCDLGQMKLLGGRVANSIISTILRPAGGAYFIARGRNLARLLRSGFKRGQTHFDAKCGPLETWSIGQTGPIRDDGAGGRPICQDGTFGPLTIPDVLPEFRTLLWEHILQEMTEFGPFLPGRGWLRLVLPDSLSDFQSYADKVRAEAWSYIEPSWRCGGDAHLTLLTDAMPDMINSIPMLNVSEPDTGGCEMGMVFEIDFGDGDETVAVRDLERMLNGTPLKRRFATTCARLPVRGEDGNMQERCPLLVTLSPDGGYDGRLIPALLNTAEAIAFSMNEKAATAAHHVGIIQENPYSVRPK